MYSICNVLVTFDIALFSAILESTEVKELLHIMLVVGNFINTGGYAGNAAGTGEVHCLK